MRKLKPLLILLIAGLAIYLMTACRDEDPITQPQKAEKSAPAAPEFTLPDVKDQNVRLSNYRGKIVVLNFWATWCPPCRSEIPDFIEAQKKYREQGVEFVGVSVDEDGKKVVAPFIEEFGLNYTVLIADEKVVNNYGGIGAIPTTFFIDRAGKIQRRYEGTISHEELHKALGDLLAMR